VSTSSISVRRWWKDPWRKPRFLQALTWGYLAWSLVPVLIAVAFSFNAGRSRSAWQGFSLRWWVGDPTAAESLLYRPELRASVVHSVWLAVATMLIAVPLGTLFAIGIDRWHGRGPGIANFTMLLSFVLPEIILGVSLFLAFIYLLRDVVSLGTTAQILGLVTYQISYPVIVVRARLLSIGKDYEEAAMDLGAPPTESVRRTLLPLLYPAIFASAALVFADTIDDFVTVRYLCAAASCEPISVKVYDAARAAPPPSINAAVTFMLLATLLAISIGFMAYRRITRAQRAGPASREFIGFQV